MLFFENVGFFYMMVGFCGEVVGIGYFCGLGSYSFVFVVKYRN